MSSPELGTFLEEAAANVRPPQCIVEVGPWLGANTARMARGTTAHKAPATVHAFDLFCARSDEVRKAAAAGLELRQGGDTRPLVHRLIESYGGDVVLHKSDIMDIEWGGTPIGLYVDDAAKTPTHFFNVMMTFAPCFVPGGTIIVLMDYRY